MTFSVRARVQPQRLGVFPGAYNPPTRAHVALATAALGHVDEVVFVIPRAFPHKPFEGASLEQRLEMLNIITAREPQFSVAVSDGGLFLEIARECALAYNPPPKLYFLCGRDAAERILGWDYGNTEAVPRMLGEFELLVAERQGAYAAPEELSSRVHRLPLEEDYDEVSATEVRDRIRKGLPWDHLVPQSIVNRVNEIYS